MEEKNTLKVCVTGGAGYIGSSLVKKLLDKGYIVHATLRNLEDESKVGVLKSFSGADERLKLFKADIYRAEEFEEAIRGCQFVCHVASPMLHYEGSQYKNITEATVDAVKKIGRICLKCGTVKRLIYTASNLASPLKEDGISYKEFIDETCWTPLNFINPQEWVREDGISFKELIDETCWTPLNFINPYTQEWLKDYAESKTLAEKEILKFEKEGLEVVALSCGLVGGHTYLPYIPTTPSMYLSMLTQDEDLYKELKFLEGILGKVPIVHIEDICEAHLFFMNDVVDAGSLNGRYLCAISFVSTAEIATYYEQNHPEFKIKQEYLNDPKRDIKWGSKKLVEKGFVYKYGMKEILDDCLSCARNKGIL